MVRVLPAAWVRVLQGIEASVLRLWDVHKVLCSRQGGFAGDPPRTDGATRWERRQRVGPHAVGAISDAGEAMKTAIYARVAISKVT